MSFRTGLTTWILRLGSVAIIWRWNMPPGEAVRTCGLRRFGGRGYLTAGPLVLEWGTGTGQP